MTTIARVATGRSILNAAGESAKWVWLQTIMDTTYPKEHKPPAHAFKTVFALLTHMNGNGTGAWPSAARLAKEIGCGERTVKRDLSTLRSMHLLRTVTRHKRTDSGYEYRPNLPDDEQVLEVARMWLSKVKNPCNTVDRATSRPNGSDPNATQLRRSGNEVPPDRAMGGPLEDHKEVHASLSLRSSLQPASPRARMNDSRHTEDGSEAEKEALAGEDWVETLAEDSRRHRPRKPCSPDQIRKHVAPLFNKHGLEVVRKVWLGRFLMNLETAGPKWFAEHFDELLAEGPTERAKETIRGTFGSLAHLQPDYDRQLRERLQIVRD